MTQTIKAALLFVVFSLCAIAAIFAPKEPAVDRESKTHVIPVNNHQPRRGVWLRV